MEPTLLLRDKRKLIYRSGTAGRKLRGLRAIDVLVGGDAQTLAAPYADTEADEPIEGPLFPDVPDTGWDFAYRDLDGRKTTVDLKLSPRDPTPSSIKNWLDRLRRITQGFERAELWVLGGNASTLRIWSDHNAPVDPNVYSLADVVWTESPFHSDRKRPIDSQFIQERVELWRTQVGALFTCITAWAAEAHYATQQSTTVRMDEELMQRFGVEPIDLPTLNILKAKAIIATARPVGLWVVGAHGRIDLLTANSNAMVVNLSRDPGAPDWRLYLGGSSTPSNFNKDLLLNFLQANEGT